MASDPRTPGDPVGGIHHVTMIAGDPQANVDFYGGVLGMRLVKITVNFDDPGTYHFYFGDDVGRPGTLLTFFPIPGAAPGRRGAGQVTAVALAVPPGSLGFWEERLQAFGVPCRRHQGPLGQPALAFADPDGLALALLEDATLAGDGASWPGWGGGPVPAAHAIRRVAGVTLTVRELEPTARVLEALGYRPVPADGGAPGGAAVPPASQAGGSTRQAGAPVTGEGAPALRRLWGVNGGRTTHWVEVVADPAARRGTMGAGVVHHVAFRTPTDQAQEDWRRRVGRLGLAVTPVQDRRYFRSIYFREPGGVLFEIATDPPGFLIDEDRDTLGRALRLPPWLEPVRPSLEQQLPPLHHPADFAELRFIHRFVPPPGETPAGAPGTAADEPAGILLLLHGTGGDENDLLPLGRYLDPRAALLSPRGQVLEEGMPRFFRRLAPGVLDPEDLAARADGMARFVAAAARRYGFDPRRVVAVGYSNGANLAAALLLRHPGLLAGAVLFRPMEVPVASPPAGALAGVPVLVAAGRQDAVVPADSSRALAQRLEEAGARVTLHWAEAGHGLQEEELRRARDWLVERKEARTR
ncbi:Glyoxalase/bleomycin resistance protein/dioxygenase [Thermaerobacter marianensis DSM 12885]|uniref:Glyoxalase/bleomycin resistance protein/dioxygenase n=1 Tax=Thermaerobacter marianensis (strain ATCC 700841 / DSM 12885 / JCM 10246 / 7p75a) TaxID=644966 RepID=E6SGM6_THEM7|nr:VOC family protein [Thermaerobacter marianensis]ADU50572.1 Glyoxalase/bleomycin resistance protein/dioxygenase [Thermaerobacter marianensis DSM 12885]